MISGINHITIAIKDLNRSLEFYKEVLGFKPLMKHSKGAYLLAGDLWFCLDVDSSTRNEPLPEYTHFAFTVDQKYFNEMVIKIKNSGTKIWKENKSEGESFYFLDPDGHKLEIHVGTWKSRITSIKKNPWNETVEFFDTNNNDSISLRKAEVNEYSFLSGLAIRSKSYWPYPADYLQKCIEVLKITEDDIRSWPASVAIKKNEVVGFFALKTVSGENTLDHLWIDPRFIGKGVGTILFRAAIKEAKEIGWNNFRIAADPFAESFYLKMGAKTIGAVQSRIKPDLFLPHMEIFF